MQGFGLGLGLTQRGRGIPSWLPLGPDGGPPDMYADWAGNHYWADNHRYGTLDGFMAGASGSFSRASDGTYFDADGVLQTAGPNVLRLTHDPVTGEALGYLAERSSVNIVTNSKGLTWLLGSDGGVIIEAPGVLGLDGVTPMTEFYVPSDATSGTINRRRAGLSITGYRSASIVCKVNPAAIDAGIHYFGFGLSRSGGSAVEFTAVFDLRTGQLAVSTLNTLADSEYLGNNMWRFKVWSLSDEQGSSLSIWLNFTASTIGYGVLPQSMWGVGHYFSDLQVEQINAAPSSYIPTEANAIIRLADSLTFARASPPEFTVVLEGINAPAPSSYLMQWDDGSDSNRVMASQNSSQQNRVALYTGQSGVPTSALIVGTASPGDPFKLVLGAKRGLFGGSMNGASAAQSTNDYGDIPLLTNLFVGSGRGTTPWGSPVSRVTFYDKCYSPSEWEAMSAL